MRRLEWHAGGAAQAAGSPVQWQGVMHIDRWANAGANMGRSGVLVSFDMKPAHFRETSHPRDGLWHRYLLQRQHQDHHPRGYAKGKCARGGLNLHDPDQDSAHVIASAAVEAYLPVQEGVWRLSETT